MLTHPTLDKLQSLKLTGMYQALIEQMNMPDIDALAFEERLGLLVDREATERDQRRLKTRLQRAKLRLSACIEDIDYRHPRGLDQSLMTGVIAPFPDAYAANRLFCKTLDDSDEALGIGLDAKYLWWTAFQTRLNLITRKSKMTCPPSIVHDIPERLSRWVNTILQPASVIPLPRGNF